MLRLAEALSFAALAVALALYAGLHLALDDTSTAVAALHGLAGYAWLPGLALLAWAALSRQRTRIAVAVAPAALGVSWVLPGTLWTAPRPGAPSLRLATANVLMVHDDPDALIAELAALDADLLVLEEVSHGWAAALEASPLLAAWRHRHVVPMDGSFGIAVLSRVPVTTEELDLMGVPVLAVDLTMDGRPLRVYGVHTLPPRLADYTEIWRAQMAALAVLPGESGIPVLLAGDLNATRHHPSYRRLLAAGLRDAHADVGRAAATTWPNGLFPLPPMRLDHVLVGDDIAVHAVREGVGAGSDHRPVVVDIGWRPAPAEPPA